MLCAAAYAQNIILKKKKSDLRNWKISYSPGREPIQDLKVCVKMLLQLIAKILNYIQRVKTNE